VNAPGADGAGPGPSPQEALQEGPRRTLWKRRFGALASIPSLWMGLVILGLYTIVGLFASVWYPGDPSYLPDHLVSGQVCPVPAGPTLSLWPLSLGAHPLGMTGGMGFDVLEGLVKGTPFDLMLLSVVILPSVTVGILVGTVAGTRGGIVDDLLMLLTDVFLSVPEFILTLVALLFILPRVPSGQQLIAFGLVLNLVLWAPFARLVRARARSVREMPFVEAARASGAGRGRIIRRHILPNSVFPVLAQVPTTLATVLLLLGGLQFANLTSRPYGCQAAVQPLFLPSPNFPEWTWVMANGAWSWLPSSSGLNPWWGYTFPAFWILLFGLGVTLTCDGLNRYLSRQTLSS
jgi:peptide/nickel transport system permease protein